MFSKTEICLIAAISICVAALAGLFTYIILVA